MANPERVDGGCVPRVLAIGAPGRAATEVPAGGPVDVDVPDITLTTASTAQVEVRAASVRGLLHRSRVEPRQDAFALRVARGSGDAEALVAVVCDGAGSLRRSQEAAHFAARRLAELGQDGAPWPDAFAMVNQELGVFAWVGDGQGDAELVMATTALALRVRRDDAGWHGEVAWVGDSSLWHLSGDGEWACCTGLDACVDDEFHASRSAALPAPEPRLAERTLDLDGGALFLMSDGVGNPLAWVEEVRDTLARWWASPPSIHDFGAQVDFARRTHVDDRTVVGLWERP